MVEFDGRPMIDWPMIRIKTLEIAEWHINNCAICFDYLFVAQLIGLLVQFWANETFISII